MSDEHLFSVSATWNPEEKEGELETADRTFGTRFAGAPSLGGKLGLVNPEELLLSALEACFVQTWAIFLHKLRVPITEPRMEGTCVVEKDPSGGYKVTRIDLSPEVPRAIWETRQEDVEKTFTLAEKYCIVSKAVKGEGRSLTVTPRIV